MNKKGISNLTSLVKNHFGFFVSVRYEGGNIVLRNFLYKEIGHIDIDEKRIKLSLDKYSGRMNSLIKRLEGEGFGDYQIKADLFS